jgi:hypothetical protein
MRHLWFGRQQDFRVLNEQTTLPRRGNLPLAAVTMVPMTLGAMAGCVCASTVMAGVNGDEITNGRGYVSRIGSTPNFPRPTTLPRLRQTPQGYAQRILGLSAAALCDFATM